jgi:VWFA-related protein
LLSALCLLPASSRLRAQDNPKFSTDVKVVSLYATVRNKQGQIVRDLTKDDFMLDEDDRPQEIRYFSQESNLPLTLGLLVDTSGSQRRVLPDERTASYRFLQQVLREDKDQAFLIHFDREVELLQDLTNSRPKLETALNGLDAPQMQRASGGQGYPGGRRGSYPGGPVPGGGQRGGRRGGGTLLYDAVYLAGDELMKKQTGRKALIVLTDGVDNGSRETLAQAVESCLRADTLVYSILFADPEAYGGGMGGFGGGRGGRRGGWGGPAMNRPDGKKVLEQVSRQTGGRFFEVSKKQPIDKVYEAIQEDLRNQYSIGYTPDRPADGAYRTIHLTARQKGLVVVTREGYYSR